MKSQIKNNPCTFSRISPSPVNSTLLQKVRGKTFLITGGAGFIGSHMCDFVIDNGGRVICVDNLSTGKKRNINQFLKNKNFNFLKADVNEFGALAEAFKRNRPDYAMHYAAMVGVKRTTENPLKVFEDFWGVKNVAVLSQKYKVKKILFSSSSEVYGEPLELPVSENSVFNARLPYGLVKILAEKYLQEWAKTSGIPVTIVRFFNVYGPRQDAGESGFVVPLFIKNALNDQPIEIFGDGRQTRDFVYISDNIRLTAKAFFNPVFDNQPVNIGSGQAVRILDLAGLVQKLIPGSRVVFKPPRTAGEIIYRRPDVSLMKKVLGDAPRVKLAEGLRFTIKHL